MPVVEIMILVKRSPFGSDCVITKGRHETTYPDVDALIWKGEQVVATIPLTGTDSSNGLFAGEVFGLDPDSYEMSVRTPGILDEMEFSDQRLRFNVRPEANKEKELPNL